MNQVGDYMMMIIGEKERERCNMCKDFASCNAEQDRNIFAVG